MAFIAPIAGALGGGALFGQIGSAVGWLVGSWLFQPETQSENKVFDPGAEEMPRFNTALRGITMPVFFGTNRLSSQIVWQHDFTTIRKETSEGGGGGGKFGGSGGKGQSAPTSQSASYQYKWDMLYHVGMIPDRYSLYGGWLGADRLSADTILAISGSSLGNFDLFFGFSDQDAIAQKASLSFVEAFFYTGAGNGSDDNAIDTPGWDEISSDMGFDMRWPHTTWIGFKQLDLGGSPHIPQLFWEIGPGNPEITFNSAFIGDAADSAIVPVAFPGGQMLKGDDGNYYACNGGVAFVFDLYRFNKTANTWTLVDTLTTAEFDADATAAGLDPGSAYTFTNSNHASVVTGHNYILATGRDLGLVLRSNVAALLYKVNLSGALEVVGGYQARSNDLRAGTQNIYCLGVSGEGTADDPIVFMRRSQVGGTQNTILQALPPINNFISDTPIINDDSGSDYDDTYVDVDSFFSTNFGNHSSYRLFESFGWILPKATIGLLGVDWTTRMYFYIGKADVEWHNDNPADALGTQYIYDNAATFPNGWVAYLSVGEIIWDSTDDTMTIPTPTGPTVDNSNFIGLFDTNARVPFDDAAENLDGTVDTQDDYHPAPTFGKLTRGQASGAYLVLFSKHFTGVEDLAPAGHFAKVRGNIYNPVSGVHKEFGSDQGSIVDTVSDLGALEANRYDYEPVERKAYWIEDEQELYMLEQWSSVRTALSDVIFSKFGDFNINGGSDVLPPYIIFEILTNPWYGIGILESRIDQASYQAALLYCEANDFRVSVQYKREKNFLDIVDEILSVYGGFLIISNGKVKFKQLEFQDGLGATVRTIDNDHLLVNRATEQPVRITKGARQDTFNKVRINYFDRSIDYQQNQVEDGDEVDQDIHGIRAREFPARFVMSEKTATTMLVRALWSNLYARDTYDFKLGWKDADLEPGDVVTLVDSFHPNLAGGVNARIVKWRENQRGRFDVTAKQEFQYIVAASGTPLDITSRTAVDLVGKVPTPRDFRMYELPREFQQIDVGVLYVGWIPDEFAAGAFLHVSPDGETFAEAARVEPYPLGGTLLTGLPTADHGAVNENVDVLLFPKSDWTVGVQSYYFNGTLNEAGPAVRAVGGAQLWIGSEMLAYETVTLLGQNRYRFSRVYRGWGGTNIQAHSTGDFWWKHGGGVFTQQFNEDKIGSLIQYKVQPFNLGGVTISIDSIDARTYTVLGENFRPQVAPTPRFVADSNDFGGKTTVFVNSTVDIAIDWKDSARLKGYGAAGYGLGDYGRFEVDPLSHNWRVEVFGSGDILVRSLEVTTATYTYTSSDNFSDNGAWRGILGFKVTPFSDAGDAPRTSVLSLELWT